MQLSGYRFHAIGLALMLLFTSSSSAQVLDQDYTPGVITLNAGFGPINTNQEQAQTFTAGVSGQLTDVEVFVKAFPGTTADMILDIRATVAGAPDPAITQLGVLGTATQLAATIPGGPGGFVKFTLVAPVPITAGTKYAIVLRSGPGAGTFGWFGEQTDPYAGGLTYERVIGNHTWGAGLPGWDLGFRTYGVAGPATAGVTIAESGGSTNVTEGGATDTYTIVLNTAPTGNVTLTLNGGTQLTAAPASITFTPANWNVPQTVTVTAIDDVLVEGAHTGTITHTAASADAAYNGIAIANVTANITDNDVGPPPPPPPPPPGPGASVPAEGSFGHGQGLGEGSFGGGGFHSTGRSLSIGKSLLVGPMADASQPSQLRVVNSAFKQSSLSVPTSNSGSGIPIAPVLLGLVAILGVGGAARYFYGR